jgi:hypothetical protein
MESQLNQLIKESLKFGEVKIDKEQGRISMEVSFSEEELKEKATNIIYQHLKKQNEQI